MNAATAQQIDSLPVDINTISLSLCFKNLALHFRLLHSVNKVLTKLLQPTDSFSFLEKMLFGKLELLKNYLNDDTSNIQVLEVNAIIRYIEKYLSTYHQNVVERNKLVSVVKLRQYIEGHKIEKPEITVLTQFEFYLHSNNEINHQKLELLLTRLLCDNDKLEDIENLITSFFNNNIYSSNLLNIHHLPKPDFIDALASVNNSVNNSENFDDLILKKSIDKLRQIKGQLKGSFWHPSILAYLIFTNVNLHNKFDRLLDQECKEIKDDAANLILHGVDYIPKINNERQQINLINVYKFVCKINKLIKQEYKSNYYNLSKLIYLNKTLKQSVEYLNNKTVTSSYNSLSFINKDSNLKQKSWAIVDNDNENNLPDPLITSLHTNNKLHHINIRPFEQNLDEEQLSNCIKHIIQTLRRRELNGKDQIIRIKYSDLVLRKEEVAIILGSIPDSNIFIELPMLLGCRAIAIYSQLHDAISFYQTKPSLLGVSVGIYGLVNLVYYWFQGQDTITAIENYVKELKQEDLATISGLISIKDKLKNILEQLPVLLNLAHIE